MKPRIIGDSIVLVGTLVLFGCGGADLQVGDSCDGDGGSAARASCDDNGDVFECRDGHLEKHVPDPNGVTCTCPSGGPGSARCVSAGFVGVDSSDRVRPRGRSLREDLG